MPQHRSLARSAFIDRVTTISAAVSCGALILMMGVTFVAVIMRYAFNSPILGGNEIIQLLSVVVVMMAMPYSAQKEAHVRVDVLDHAIGPYGRLAGDVLARVFGAFVLFLLAKRAWFKMLDTLEFEDATNMLQIQIWPFYGLITIGMAAYMGVLLLQLIDTITNGPLDNE